MPSFEDARRLMAQAVQDKIVPSAALAVGIKDTVFLMETWGRTSLPDGPLANVHTRYDMASLTKVIATSMIAFHALEHGLICLYDSIGLFLDAPAEKQGITIRHLLTHTGGIVDHIMLSEEISDPQTVCDCILAWPLSAAVGERVIYSCMGFILLGAILEKVYGKPLDVLAQTLVFDPLGMKNTGYCPQGENFAATEADPQTGRMLCGVVHDENARFLGGVSANAGLFSDIQDCARFASMLAMGGALEGKQFLSPAMLKTAIQNYTPGNDQHRGLGFHLAGTEGNFMGDLFPPCSFGHTGFTGTSLAVDPTTGLYIVLLTNRVHPTRQNSGHLRLRRLLHNAVYAAFSREMF